MAVDENPHKRVITRGSQSNTHILCIYSHGFLNQINKLRHYCGVRTPLNIIIASCIIYRSVSSKPQYARKKIGNEGKVMEFHTFKNLKAFRLGNIHYVILCY